MAKPDHFFSHNVSHNVGWVSYSFRSWSSSVTLFIREFELKCVLEQKLMRIGSGATWF